MAVFLAMRIMQGKMEKNQVPGALMEAVEAELAKRGWTDQEETTE